MPERDKIPYSLAAPPCCHTAPAGVACVECQDWLTGETMAQMITRDQANQQDSFSTWWVFWLGVPVILYLVLHQGRPKL